ncbi:hypothetical protein RUMCAL_02742 [Ruminococcus callidus ATCC 27760]|uniref:Uncharacterized protein n=1 Tax=Ruminococcus callidus ATCC 27760 TaxID=411473 RepID=U2JX32_9FIRM|nr:hypothetical protein RUMCAL_02742 [Ruminococcus callidus ATCC 27760]
MTSSGERSGSFFDGICGKNHRIFPKSLCHFHRIFMKINVTVKKAAAISSSIILYRRKCCNHLDKKNFSW